MVSFSDKKLNQNHKKVPDEDLWTREKFTQIREHGFVDTTRLNQQFYAKSIFDKIETEEHCIDLLNKHWTIESKEEYLVLVLHQTDMELDLIQNAQMEKWLELREIELKDGESLKWLFLYDLANNIFIEPTPPIEVSRSWIKQTVSKKTENEIVSGEYRQVGSISALLLAIFQRELQIKPFDEILDQLQKSEEKLDKWQKSLNKHGNWEEDESVLFGGKMDIRRSNWKVRSNLTKRGDFFVTNKKIVFSRRKFGFLGFAMLFPLLAFVRPSNKILLVFNGLYQIIKWPLQFIKAFKPGLSALWPVIPALFFSRDFINTEPVVNAWERITAVIPGINRLNSGISWGIANPHILSAILGSWLLIRLLLKIAFFRSEELIVIPLEQINSLYIDNNLLVSRMKVKGSKSVRAPDKGLEFKMRLTDKSKSNGKRGDRNQILIADMFYHLLGSNNASERNSDVLNDSSIETIQPS